MSEKEKLSLYYCIINGLIHYHERVASNKPNCTQDCHHYAEIKECPTIAFADVYREALVKAAELIKQHIDQL